MPNQQSFLKEEPKPPIQSSQKQYLQLLSQKDSMITKLKEELNQNQIDSRSRMADLMERQNSERQNYERIIK